jgi:hypothetical protein
MRHIANKMLSVDTTIKLFWTGDTVPLITVLFLTISPIMTGQRMVPFMVIATRGWTTWVLQQGPLSGFSSRALYLSFLCRYS